MLRESNNWPKCHLVNLHFKRIVICEMFRLSNKQKYTELHEKGLEVTLYSMAKKEGAIVLTDILIELHLL